MVTCSCKFQKQILICCKYFKIQTIAEQLYFDPLIEGYPFQAVHCYFTPLFDIEFD